jgi:ATP/maltotriose-dependent transcriptional regulator MalT
MALAARDVGDVERARRQLDAGVALLADQPASEELVRIHHTRLLIDSPLFEPDRAASTVEALVVAADTLASPAAKAASLSAEAHLALGRGNFRLARSKVEASLRVAESAGDLLLMQRAQRDLAWVTWADADISTCEAQVAAQLEIDRRLGARAQEPLSQIQFAIFAHFRGEWENVESMAEAALAQAQRYGQRRALTIGHGTLAWFLADRGELDRSQEQLAEAARTIDVNGGDRALHWIRIPEALLALERGDSDRARAAASQLPLPKGRSILADAHLLAGESDVARTIGRRLASAGPPGSYAVAMGERTLGLVARADGEVSTAAELLSSSAAALAEIGLPFEAAISQFYIGTPEALRAGLATFERLGAQRWADRARKALRALGIRVMSPRRRFPTPEGLPLSRRELEVARLVADGLSSAEIASRLVLSVRTVESHLDHIYARLGISGRAALTRWIATNVGEVP